MEKLRICFAGTPAFAAAHLQALLKAGHQVVAVYTQPDRPAGRGKNLQASPVKQVALENRLPLFQPTSLKSIEQTQTIRVTRLRPYDCCCLRTHSSKGNSRHTED